MSLKEILDLQLNIAIPLSDTEFPVGVMLKSVFVKQFIIVPTNNIAIHAVNWGIIYIYNIGRNNEKEDLIVRYTNKSGEADAQALTAWTPLNINADDFIVGKGELIKAKSEVNGVPINLGFVLQVIEIEAIG